MAGRWRPIAGSISIGFLLIIGLRAAPIRESACGPFRADGCRCVNATNGERPCCCVGQSVVDVPNDLWPNVTKLIFKEVGFAEINASAFHAYSNVAQIELSYATELTVVDAEAFHILKRLKKLSILDCPKLERINGHLMEHNKDLLILEIRRTSLKRMPKCKMAKTGLSVPSIDFSQNQITTIETGEAADLRASVLKLNENQIRTIHDFAFRNSQIFLLRLNNNPIESLSFLAFSNISALNKLDLSYTEIPALPEDGLSGVEELSVEHTPTMKQLPPLFVFSNLKAVRLTYPYHCCLFKYATSPQYVKLNIKKHEGDLMKLREKYCFTDSPTSATTTAYSTLDFTTTLPEVAQGQTKPLISKLYTLPSVDRVISSNKTELFTEEVQSEVSSTLDFDAVDTTNGWTLAYEDYGNRRLKRQVQQTQARAPKQDEVRKDWQWIIKGFGAYLGPDSESEEHVTVVQISTSTKSAVSTPRSNSAKPIRIVLKKKTKGTGKYKPIHGAHDVGVWEPKEIVVQRVVVPCVDGDRGVHDYYDNVTCSPQPDMLNPCEDVMIGWYLRLLNFLVWPAAIVGNVLVIVVLFISNQPRQRVNNFLMMNLAFSDLCTGVYLAMLSIRDITTMGEYYNYAVAWQTGWGCKLAGTLSIFGSELSIVTMVLISFEVWFNTKYVFFGKRLQFGVTVLVMVGGWVMSALLAVLPMLGVSDYSVTSTCLPLYIESTIDQVYLVFCLALNVVGFTCIVCFYAAVYCMVAGSDTPTAHQQDMAIAKRMLILIVTDFVCWAPTVFFGLTAAFYRPLIGISVVKVFLVVFYPLNAFANPWLYVFLTKMFRKNVAHLIRRNVWLREFLLNHAPRQQCCHCCGSQNYIYQYQPTNQTQTTAVNSRRSSCTCSTSYITPRNSINGDLPVCAEGLLVTGPNAPLTRRKSTQRFRPQMSDIIESSNSNSLEEDNRLATKTEAANERSVSTCVPPVVEELHPEEDNCDTFDGSLSAPFNYASFYNNEFRPSVPPRKTTVSESECVYRRKRSNRYSLDLFSLIAQGLTQQPRPNEYRIVPTTDAHLLLPQPVMESPV